jgi:homoprotocatechuate degradation regulator HpaR
MNLHNDPLIDSNQPESEGSSGPRQTRRSLPIALLRARESVMSRFRPMLARHNINEQQWRVIRILGERGELDATQLAERALVLGPSLTRMIKTLEKSKLIVKRNDKTDGRRTLVSITPKAKALIKEVTPESAKIYNEIEKRFGAHEIERLLDLLELISKESDDEITMGHD